MLVSTNDAFTGLDALPLGGRGTTVATMADDAGSERDNKLAAYIPVPAATTPSRATPRAS
jgi:hypothetical protein